jgi:hypothetical protein
MATTILSRILTTNCSVHSAALAIVYYSDEPVTPDAIAAILQENDTCQAGRMTSANVRSNLYQDVKKGFIRFKDGAYSVVRKRDTYNTLEMLLSRQPWEKDDSRYK